MMDILFSLNKYGERETFNQTDLNGDDMTGQKFKASFKFPCNVHCNSPYAKEWSNATPETHPNLYGETLYFLAENGKLYRKQPKHYIGVINQRAAGGKWEECLFRRGESAVQHLDRRGASPADFRGQPRVKPLIN